MTSALVHSVYCVTGAAVLSAPFLVRHPRTLTAMLQDLDEELLHRVSWLVNGPKRDEVQPFEFMEAITEGGGFLHLLSQARLMTGIAIEAGKHQPSDEAATMRRHTRELWRVAGLCCILPSAYAKRVAMILSEMAATVEPLIIQNDRQLDGV